MNTKEPYSRLVKNAVEELLSFKSLQPGWDGYKGVPIHRSTIATAKRLLETRQYLPEDPLYIEVSPISDGRVDIESVWSTHKETLTVEGHMWTVTTVKVT